MDSLCQKMKSPGQSVDLIHNILPALLTPPNKNGKNKKESQNESSPICQENLQRIILAVQIV